MQSPFETNLMLSSRIMHATRITIVKHVAEHGDGEDSFQNWLALQTDQDCWDDVLKLLPAEDYKSLEGWFEHKGCFPTQDVIDLFSTVEKEIFGKSVVDQL